MNAVGKKAVEIISIDIERYGILYNMAGGEPNTGNVRCSKGDGWEDGHTTQSLIDTTGSLGYTRGTGTPFTAREMERHLHTQEALFPIDQPIVFLIAPASEEAPKSEDVIPVILRPGQVVVLHRGTWHSSAHGLTGPAHYHYLAQVYANEPTLWKDIQGGPIYVEL